MNLTSGQWRASPDAGLKNPTGQEPGSHSSVSKLQLLIYKSPNCIALCAGKQKADSAEVGALGPVFQKSARELKQKQKWLKCTVHIAILNIRTLNRIGQLPELTASAAEHNIDIYAYKKTDAILSM